MKLKVMLTGFLLFVVQGRLASAMPYEWDKIKSCCCTAGGLGFHLPKGESQPIEKKRQEPSRKYPEEGSSGEAEAIENRRRELTGEVRGFIAEPGSRADHPCSYAPEGACLVGFHYCTKPAEGFACPFDTDSATSTVLGYDSGHFPIVERGKLKVKPGNCNHCGALIKKPRGYMFSNCVFKVWGKSAGSNKNYDIPWTIIPKGEFVLYAHSDFMMRETAELVIDVERISEVLAAKIGNANSEGDRLRVIQNAEHEIRKCNPSVFFLMMDRCAMERRGANNEIKRIGNCHFSTRYLAIHVFLEFGVGWLLNKSGLPLLVVLLLKPPGEISFSEWIVTCLLN